MRAYASEVGRAFSRLLNALIGNSGDVTLSAQATWLMLHGRTARRRWWGLQCCRAINTLWRDRSHCLCAYFWHQDRELFPTDQRR